MPSSPYWILDEQGEPQPVETVLDWALWFERSTLDGSRVIAHDRDETPGGPDVLVSTVFLGVDYSFLGLPLLFETMILGGLHDGYCRRSPTRETALEQHRIACALMNESTR